MMPASSLAARVVSPLSSASASPTSGRRRDREQVLAGDPGAAATLLLVKNMLARQQSEQQEVRARTHAPCLCPLVGRTRLTAHARAWRQMLDKIEATLQVGGKVDVPQ